MTTVDWKNLYPDLSDEGYQWSLPENASEVMGDRWREWLLAPGSLTKRLQELSAGAFEVDVLEAQWEPAQPMQVRALGIHTADQIWSRRVVLRGKGTPWVVAHSYFAGEPMLQSVGTNNAIDAVLTLGRQPLGALLFEHPKMQRGPIEICKTHTGWGRRSRFSLEGEPIVVAEYFLEALLSEAMRQQSRSE